MITKQNNEIVYIKKNDCGTSVYKADTVDELLHQDIFFTGDLEYNKSKTYDEHYIPFDTEHTGIPKYDKIVGDNIVTMSPSDYVERCADLLGTTYEDLLLDRFADNTVAYAQDMLAGNKFNTPVIDYNSKFQDGIHRAMACMILGNKLMPVVVVE